MTQSTSHKEIIKSTTMIGGSSVINILLGLLRTKIAAILLGPSGIGMIGILTNLMTTAATISSLGLGNVGTQQIAQAVGAKDEKGIASARRVLFFGTLFLALLGAILVWLLRDWLAVKVLGNPNAQKNVGWMALGVALSVASGSQSALLSGLRRMSDIAKITIFSGLLSSVMGIAAIALMDEIGIVVYVLMAPLGSFIFGHWYVSKLPKITTPAIPFLQLLHQLKLLVQLGFAFMIAGLAMNVSQLVVRALIQRDFGLIALGHFQAAWSISMIYIGFILQSMGRDYFPRLTATINDHVTTNRLVNEQTEIALLVAGPIFLAMLGLTPWIVSFLYSNEFADSVSILRWQILGDLLKVSCWPLGFINLAAGDGRTFMLTNTFAFFVFVVLCWLGLPLLGIEATGIAFFGMYVIYLPIVFFLAKKRTGFYWQVKVYKLLAVLSIIAMMIFCSALWSNKIASFLGVGGTILMGVYSLIRLDEMLIFDGKFPIFLRKILKIIKK